MTESERKRYSHLIALVLGTKARYLWIERLESVNERETRVFLTYKGNRFGALVCQDTVLQTWRVV